MGLEIDVILRAMEYADSLKDHSSFKKCVTLFESHRSLAAKHQKKRFKSIQNDVLNRQNDSAKNILSDDSLIRIF
jgi:hypothetical protein